MMGKMTIAWLLCVGAVIGLLCGGCLIEGDSIYDDRKPLPARPDASVDGGTCDAADGGAPTEALDAR